MHHIRRCALPADALLQKYERNGAYADCYCTVVAGHVSHAAFVEAFYTTALFKVERRLLAWFVAKPSTDVEASELAAGDRDTFAAWSVEARSADQLLLTDFQAHTRSWLMVAPAQSGAPEATRLYFGSAVVPTARGADGSATLGVTFRLLLGFHTLYSRALLSAARSRLAGAPAHP
jgi:hypothetical protein